MQTYLTQKITHYFARQHDVVIEVEAVDIGLFNHVLLRNVYVEDQRKDTLLFLETLDARISYFDFSSQTVTLSSLTFEQPVIKLYSDSLEVMNFEFLLGAPKEKDDPETEMWNVKCRNFEIDNGQFAYRDFYASDNDSTMNFSDLSFYRLNMHLEEFEIQQDTFLFHLESLNCREKSGFTLQHFGTEVKFSPQQLYMNQLALTTGSSEMTSDHIHLNYNSFDDFSNFTTNVGLDIQVDSCSVGMHDIGYFSSFLLGLTDTIWFTGAFSGRVDSLIGQNFELRYANSTRFSSDFNLQGLPAVDSADLQITNIDFQTNSADLNRVPLPPFSEGKHLELPDTVAKLGLISYQGNFRMLNGLYFPEGEILTAAGEVTLDMEVLPDTTGTIQFGGTVKTHRLDIGKIIGNEDIGILSLNTSFEGYSSEAEPFSAHIAYGRVLAFEFNDYTYKNIEFGGDATSGSFNGQLNIDDPALKMTNRIVADFSNDSMYFFEGISKLRYAYLNVMHLDTAHQGAMLSCEARSRFSGNNLDNLKGQAEIIDLLYENNQSQLSYDNISLELKQNEDSTRLIQFEVPKAFSAKASGKFGFETLSASLSGMLASLLPSIFGQDSAQIAENPPPLTPLPPSNEYIDFEINFLHLTPITKIFMSDVYIDSKTSIKGYYEARTEEFEMTILSNTLEYKTYKLNNFVFNARKTGDVLTVNSGVKQFFVSDSTSFDNVIVRSDVLTDSVTFQLKWNNWGDINNKGAIKTAAAFDKPDGHNNFIIDFHIFPSEIMVSDTVWRLSESHIVMDSTAMKISDFIVYNPKVGDTTNIPLQYIKIDGNVSESLSDTLFLAFKDIDIAHLNLLTAKQNMEFGGILNGNAKVTNVYESPVLFADNTVESFAVNRQRLGDFNILSDWQPDSRRIYLRLFSKLGVDTTINISGYYSPDNGMLDFNTVKIKKFPLKILNPFLEGVATIYEQRRITDSKLYGDLTLRGTLEHPQLNGMFRLQRMLLEVDYLKTTFFFTDTLYVENNNLIFKDLRLVTPPSGLGKINGSVTHNNFQDFKIDLNLQAYEMLVLDRAEKDADFFYGKILIDAIANVKGTPDDMNVELYVEPVKNSNLSILLNTSSEASETNFITFVSAQDTTSNAPPEKDEEYSVDFSGIDMKFDLKLTPETALRIIFDEKTGEVITVKGDADLQVGISPFGDLTLVGEYTIEQGDYLFTLQNLINKRFKVESGSSISWHGDPMDALLDVTAIYTIPKVSVFDLTYDEADKDNRVKVECILNMTGNLERPGLQFAIRLPEAEERIRSRVETLPEDELNKQFLSLLIVNRFQPMAGIQGDASVSLNTGELLSNQLSLWLSQISNDFDIGVNYRPGDELSADEVEVALSTQFFDDKFKVNVGVTGGQENMANPNNPAANNSAANIMGDFEIEYKFSKKLRIKAYTKANDNMIYDSPYKQGVGVFYRKDFNSFDELELFKMFKEFIEKQRNEK